jgi:hypothetical protein
LPAARSDKRHAFASQHGGELHQRQPDQRARVVAADFLDQHDAKTLDLGAAGAIVGPLRLQVALDLALAVITKSHLGRHFRRLQPAAPGIEQRERGMKQHGPAPHGLELRDRLVVAAGLAEMRAVERCDLVAADHQGTWMPARYRSGLGLCQAQRRVARAFAREGGFVHFRGLDVEGQPQALEQGTPVGRGRGKYEAGRVHR